MNAHDPANHTRLIEANRAFFNGDRAETRRLLAAYGETAFVSFEGRQWLQAHAQDDYDDMLEALRVLVARGDPDSHYVEMARAYLAQEHELQAMLTPSVPPPRRRVQVLSAVTLAAVSLFVVFLLLSSHEAGEATLPTLATPDPLSITQPTQQRLDRSQALFGDTYTVRYDTGILQITAIEDRSERVLDRNTMLMLTPVPGARFVALALLFECRSGICRQPPEAEVFLRLSEGELVSPRTDVVIDSADTLRPVALGRTTSGWLVFEISALSRPEALIIRSFADDTGTRPPDMEIALPLF